MKLIKRNNKIYKRLNDHEMLIFDLETKDPILRSYEETRQGYSKTYFMEEGLCDLDKRDSFDLEKINLLKNFQEECQL